MDKPPRTKTLPASKTPPTERGDTAKPGGDGGFLDRWSRLKREARENAVEKPPTAAGPTDPTAPPPDLPPTDALTFDSDYRQFFHPKVGEDLRRAALKKLFSDPRFNVMDGLDVYIDDYSKTEPIPAAMLAGLKQAQNILQWAKEDAEERRKAETGAENVSGEADPAQASLESPEARTGSAAAQVEVTEPVPASTSGALGSERS